MKTWYISTDRIKNKLIQYSSQEQAEVQGVVAVAIEADSWREAQEVYKDQYMNGTDGE